MYHLDQEAAAEPDDQPSAVLQGRIVHPGLQRLAFKQVSVWNVLISNSNLNFLRLLSETGKY